MKTRVRPWVGIWRLAGLTRESICRFEKIRKLELDRPKSLTDESNSDSFEPVATERFHNLPPARQSAILHAAMAEFAAGGFAKAKMEDIAKAAGVTKGLLYYYFEDRDDLLATLYQQVSSTLRPLLSGLPRWPVKEQFWSWLEGVYAGVITTVLDQPVLMAFMVRILTDMAAGSIPPGFEKHMAATRNGVTDVIAAGQRCGAVRDDLPQGLLMMTAFSLMTACDRWITGEASSGRLTAFAAKPVLELYRSAFQPPRPARTRRQ